MRYVRVGRSRTGPQRGDMAGGALLGGRLMQRNTVVGPALSLDSRLRDGAMRRAALILAVAGPFLASALPAAAALPDLVVRTVDPSKKRALVGDTITVEVEVREESNVDAGPFIVALFYNRATPPSVGDTPDDTQSVSGLAAKQKVYYTFNVTNATPEVWQIYAIVDNGQDVAEANETNNVGGPAELTWTQPDLIILNVVPSNANPTVGDTISVAVTVKNPGDGFASNFSVDLFFNPAAPPVVGDAGDRRQNVASLVGGGLVVLTFDIITNTVAETWGTYAVVDTTSSVDETSETNNVHGPAQIVWTPVGASPELTITAVAPSSTTPSAGSTITVDVTVANQGNADVGSFRLDLFYDRATAPTPGDTGDQNKPVSGLTQGTSTTVTFTGVTSAVPADWSMYSIVDTLNGVAESDEADNVAGPAAVQWQGVDLVIIAVTPTDSTPLMGGSINVDVTVQNLGNIAAGAFDVGLFYDEPSAPSAGDAGTNGKGTPQNVASLAAGATTTVTFVGVTSSSAGTWSMYAASDDGLAVSEYDETNNVSGPVAVTWRAPDLVILSITPSNTSPTAGDNIDVEVVVKNQGDADAVAFDVGLYYNESAEPSPGDGADRTENVAAGLAAGAETTVTFTNVTSAIAASWQMYAVADDKVPASDDVEESDEGNNAAGPVGVVWGSVGTSPDLIIVSVSPTNSDPAIGEAISVDVIVENQGTADAGAFNIGLFYDEAAPPNPGDPADKTKNVSSLAQSTQTTVTFTGVTSSTTGSWSMYAVADNGLAIAESEEGNNVSTAAAVTWHAPELVITSVVPSSADPDVGTSITVDVTVMNNGDAPASAFDVAFFYNEASAPAVGDAADQTKNVASLGIGASTVVQFTGITSSSSGAWSMYAIADNGSAVLESNESNNVDGPTAVTWHGPDLVVSAITPSNSAPTTAETISVDVTVRNLGDRDATAFDVALFYNKATSPSVGDIADQTQNVGSLVAGDLTTVTFSGITNTVEEVWKTWAIADNGSAVTEGDETNNVGGPVAIIWGTPAVADLVVISITPSNASPNVAETISVDVVIANNGTLDASLFNVGLYGNLAAAPSPGDPADQTKGVGTLAAGAQKTLTFTNARTLWPRSGRCMRWSIPVTWLSKTTRPTTQEAPSKSTGAPSQASPSSSRTAARLGSRGRCSRSRGSPSEPHGRT